MIEIAGQDGFLGRFNVLQVLQWLAVRNDVAHSHVSVDEKRARVIVNSVEEITGLLLR